MYRQVEESQTLLINTQSKTLTAQNKDVIKFGFGQSPFLPPPQVVEALQSAAFHKEYSSVQGDDELRALMARFHLAHNGLSVHPENILVAPGSKILLYAILMSFRQADVFIPVPGWVSYAPQAKLAGHHAIKLTTSFASRWRLTPELLRTAAQKKQHEVSVLILNYPGNPDGLTYTEEELTDLARVAKELDLLVIADEIYGLLNHSNNHVSFVRYYPEKTITTTGLSKWCGAGGWRLGAAFLYDAIESAFKQALIGIASETYSCAPTPVQIAAKEAYRDFAGIAGYLTWQQETLAQIGNFCAQQLNAFKVRVHPPQGGFYLFPDFSPHREKLHARGIYTSSELCRQLLQDTGVALLPAVAFGFDEQVLAARLAYVDFPPPASYTPFTLADGCPRVVAGIEKIGRWVADL